MGRSVPTDFDQQVAANRAKKKAKIIKVTGISVLVIFVSLAVYALMLNNVSSLDSGNALQELALEPANDRSAVDRQSLQKTLNELKQKLEVVTSDPGMVNWQRQKIEAMQGALALAYDYYTAREYSKAESVLNKLALEIDKLIEDYAKAFESLHSQAQTAFDKGQIENAQGLNTQSLAINAEYLPAVLLQKRIRAFPQLSLLKEQVRVAEVENNLSKQRRALQQIVALDAHQDDAKQKLAGIESLLRRNEYAKHYANALQAYNNQQYAQAQASLTVAAGLGNSQSETQSLQLKIDDALRYQGAASTESQLSIFRAADEWGTVQLLAQKAVLDYPNNKLIQDALQNANKINVLHKTLEGYLDQPMRLSDSNIRSRAQNDIVKTQSLGLLSPKLQQKAKQLAALIQQENQPQALTIKSDGLTTIEVLGEGMVGKIKSKTISLKPGTYRLQGTRKGYRTVILPLLVEKSASPIVVSLVCSQKI
jgi:hypothetical protein